MRFALPALSLLALGAACASTDLGPMPRPLEGRTHALTMSISAQVLGQIDSAAIAELLETSGTPGDLVSLETRTLLVRPEVLPALLGSRVGSPRAIVLQNEGAARLAGHLQKYDQAEDLTTQTLSIEDGQPGHVMVVNQRAYVSGFELSVQENQAVVDPQVDVVMDGMQMIMRPYHDQSSASTRLELELELVEISEKMPMVDVDLGTGSKVTMQRPTGVTRSLVTEVTLHETETLAIAGLRSPMDAERGLLLLIRTVALPQKAR